MMRSKADDRVHFSDLVEFARSPAHYKYAVENPRERTRAMLIGTIADAVVFGTELPAVYEGRRAGKDWEAFAAAHADATICNVSEWNDGTAAGEAIKADPVAGPILAACHTQVVLQWEQNGVPCASGITGIRGGIDAIDTTTGTIWDVKCVGVDVDPDGLGRHAWRRWWHAQLAWLIDGWNAGGPIRIAGVDIETVDVHAKIQHGGLICVESSPPHIVTVLRLTPRAIEEGRKSVRLWLERYKSCAESGVWPGYVQDVASMDVPAWMGEENESA